MNKMKKAVVIPIDGKMNMIDVPDDIDWRWMGDQIGSDWIEIVRPVRLEDGYVMIVDEEGKLKSNFINLRASWLYGSDEHGDPIVGEAMILKEIYGDEGPECAGMDLEEAEKIAEMLAD